MLFLEVNPDTGCFAKQLCLDTYSHTHVHIYRDSMSINYLCSFKNSNWRWLQNLLENVCKQIKSQLNTSEHFHIGNIGYTQHILTRLSFCFLSDNSCFLLMPGTDANMTWSFYFLHSTVFLLILSVWFGFNKPVYTLHFLFQCCHFH